MSEWPCQSSCAAEDPGLFAVLLTLGLIQGLTKALALLGRPAQEDSPCLSLCERLWDSPSPAAICRVLKSTFSQTVGVIG